MNTPLRNCFQKFCFDTQSSITNIREWLSAATADSAWDAVMSRAPITWMMMSSKAVNMHAVWKVSVHTSVFTPPRRV